MRLIDADALWKKFSVNPNTGERYRTRDCDNFPVTVNLEAVQREIRSAPTIDPLKHGRWVKPVPGDGEPYCSVCKCYQPWVWRDGYQQYTFCPYCGAKMDFKPSEAE